MNPGGEPDGHEVVRVEHSAGSGGYVVSETPAMVLVPARKYVTVEVTSQFHAELVALRRVARLVAVTTGAGELGYDDLPLEGFWHSDDTTRFDPTRLGVWRWRAAIRLPGDLSDRAIQSLILGQSTHAEVLRLVTMSEGRVVQALHRGPYDTIGATIDKIHRELDRHHLEASGDHHEIYLTDPATTPPTESRTVIRQAVRRSHPERPPSVFDNLGRAR